MVSMATHMRFYRMGGGGGAPQITYVSARLIINILNVLLR